MMNKRSASKLVAALMILSPVVISRAQSPALEAPAAVLIDDDSGVQMRAKLDRSKQVLEGLVRQDFAAIARAARVWGVFARQLRILWTRSQSFSG